MTPTTSQYIEELEQQLALTSHALAQARKGQPARHSALETLLSTATGFYISILANYYLLPIWGYSPSFITSLEIGVLFTIISILRGYAFRRLFNYFHISRNPS